MSKLIPLTQGKYAIVDDGDYKLVSRFDWHAQRTKHLWYARCKVYLGRINKKSIYGGMLMHRLILKPPKDMDIDHRNNNGLDCHRFNMRICTHAENVRNQHKRTDGFSVYKGVSWDKCNKFWRSFICLNGKKIYLGHFGSEIEAAFAYDRAAIKYFGEYACLNIPTKTT